MLKIANKPCNQCLFSDQKIVSNKRKQELVSSCLKNDLHFECHKGTMNDDKIVCHGWHLKYSSSAIRMATKLKYVEFVDPNKL